MRQIMVTLYETTTGEKLGGTVLATAPGPGRVTVRAASSVNTATLSLSGMKDNPTGGQAQAIKLRANGEIRTNEDTPWQFIVNGGETLGLTIGGTPGTIGLQVEWMGK